MNADWSPLRRELALWRAHRLTLPLWWRDDDAIAATSALEQLSRLSDDLGLPIHLAVIPDAVENSLRDAVCTQSVFIPIIHGWAHRNTAPIGAKKSEFDHQRSGSKAELEQALTKMLSVFDTRLVRVFVPPWNRLHSSNLQILSDVGYQMVSAFQPRRTAMAAPGLLQVNTHLDPIDWHGTRDLLDPDQIIATAVELLKTRRVGRADNSEPFGYLTHHLVHTSPIWDFSRAFLNELLEGVAKPTSLASVLKEIE
ncbi:MAG: polysaccharide deacetylase [Paracoccaceae bacterium]|nr:polysaccharide deacetylase [Paracoccaceae bacterium]